MRHRLPLVIIILAVSSLLIIPYGMIAPAYAVATPTVFVSPSTMPLAPANTLVTFNVSVSNIPAFGGWDIIVSVVNPTILKPVSINLVDNFSGTALTFSDCVNAVGQGCSGSDGAGVAHSAVIGSSTSSGNLTLFSVTYNSTASSGYTSISIKQDFGSTLISDSSGNAIPVDVSGAVYGNAASAPIAVFSWSPLSPYAGESVVFNASLSYDPSGGKITTYEWPSKTTTIPVTTLVFPYVGNQTVTLIVKDDRGLISLATTHIVQVRAPCPPGASVIRVPYDCPSISLAVQWVAPGGTVLVGPGIYSDNIEIIRPLTLRGAGINSTVIKGGMDPFASFFIASFAPNVTISGFTLNETVSWQPVLIESSRNILANNTIIGTVVLSTSIFPPVGPGKNTLYNDSITGDVLIHGNPATVLVDNLIRGALRIDTSANCLLRGNHVGSFAVTGFTVADYAQDVDMSNTINGRPIYYVVGVNNAVIPIDAGYLGFVNSSNITIGPGLPTLMGITLVGTQNVQISGVRVAVPSRGPGPGGFPSNLLVLDIAFSSNIVIQNSTFEGPNPIFPFYCCFQPLDIVILLSNNVVVRNSIFNQTSLDVQDSTSIVAVYDTVVTGGIALSASNGAQVMNNNLTSTPLVEPGSFFAGIQLLDSNSSILARNSISDYDVGIFLLGSHSNLLEANVIHGERCLFCYPDAATGGIFVLDSPQNTLRNNQIIGAYASLQVDSHYPTCFYDPAQPCQRPVDYAQDIDPSNTIDGRPIYYLVGTHDQTVPSTAGYVAIVNSTRVKVDSINLSYSGDGIQIIASTDVLVEDSTVNAPSSIFGVVGISGLDSENLTISGNRLIPSFGIGISLAHCSNVIVEGNIIQFPMIDFQGEGVRLVNTSNSTVEGNYISHYGHVGIRITDSTNDTINRNTLFSFNLGPYGILIEQTVPNPTHNLVIENTIADNLVGLSASPGNTIYQNNFLDNSIQAQGPGNTWNNGAGQGNYWSDYKGQDLDEDGVGDTLLPHLGLDSYPLMSAWMPSGLSATLLGNRALSKHRTNLSVGTNSIQTLSVSARNNGTAAEWIQAVFNITSANGQTQTVAVLAWVLSGQRVVLSTPVNLAQGSYTVTVQLRFSSDAFLSWTPVATGPSA